MAFDRYGGGERALPRCPACKTLITSEEETVVIKFPDDCADMSGTYHAYCSRPFISLAHALNVLSRHF